MSKYVPRRLILSLVMLSLVVAFSALAVTPKLDQAIAAQQKRIADRPNDAVVHNDLANLLAAAGRLEAASAAYDRAVTLAPNAAAVRFNRALLLHQMGRLEAAKADYMVVLDWQPGHAWAHYQMGTLAAEEGQKEAAIKSYAKAFALDTELALAEVNPHVIDNELLTESLLRAGEYETEGGLQVPRQYGEGDRIAKLLLARSVAADEEDGEGDEAAETAAEEAEAESERPRRRRGKSTPVETSGNTSRVLDSSSLEKGSSIGQAKSSGVAPTARSGAAPRRSRSAVRVRSGGHQAPTATPRTRQEPTPTQPPRRGTAPSRAPAVGQNTPRGVVPRYRPTRRSTSSLSLELLPAGAPAASEAAFG